MAATPSSIINSRYEVRRDLGKGSYGHVFEVFDHHLRRATALKLLDPVTGDVWEEAEVLCRVSGEYLLPVLNADLASGVAFIETELATHGSLADHITPFVGMPSRQAVTWARHACQGVARLHDHQLLHRDIKPGNIFLNDKRDALVADLGLARLWNADGLAEAAGTLRTMAPEVAAEISKGGSPGKTYSVRSDVYSLGATLFWMLAGTWPHAGSGALLDRIVSGQSPSLWDWAPHITRGLRDAVEKAIAHDPASRYPTPADFDAALGGRVLPKRDWTRTKPHVGHAQCYTGSKGMSRLDVCVTMTPNAKSYEAQVLHHASGRRAAPTQRFPIRQIAQRLRSIFRTYQ